MKSSIAEGEKKTSRLFNLNRNYMPMGIHDMLLNTIIVDVRNTNEKPCK